MKNETEFLAEIYARHDRNLHIRKRKYIKTAVSLCLFVLIGTALPSVFSGPRKSAESEDLPTSNGTTISNAETDENTKETTTTAQASANANQTESVYERFDFGTNIAESITDENDPMDTYCIKIENFPVEIGKNDLTYPFPAEAIVSVTVQNSKGKTYYLSSEQGVSIFYSYLLNEKEKFIPSSQIKDDTQYLYITELRFFIGESKTFYIMDKNTAEELESLMKKLQENEP
ncbi:MAG: hypothetical protein IJ489_04650 [Clostridia bacterium]|nr:hypothetical protein [Clostridia bacterium]